MTKQNSNEVFVMKQSAARIVVAVNSARRNDYKDLKRVYAEVTGDEKSILPRSAAKVMSLAKIAEVICAMVGGIDFRKTTLKDLYSSFDNIAQLMCEAAGMKEGLPKVPFQEMRGMEMDDDQYARLSDAIYDEVEQLDEVLAKLFKELGAKGSNSGITKLSGIDVQEIERFINRNIRIAESGVITTSRFSR